MNHADGFMKSPSVGAFGPRKRKRGGSTTGGKVFKRPPCPLSPTWISTTHNAPSFYDLLPRIELTRRALQELNRRTNLTTSPASPAAAIPAESSSESLPLRGAEISVDLKRFARTGGTDLSGIRGFQRPLSVVMAKTRNSSHAFAEASAVPPPNAKSKSAEQRVEPSDESKRTGKTSAYDNNFMTILAERNIEPPKRTKRPANYDELTALLEQPRSSLSPSDFSDQDFDQFLDDVENARTESMVMSYVFPRILGSTRYPFTMDKSCTNWAPLVSDAELVTPQPDHYDGIRAGPENKLLRQYLDKIIVPAADAPFLPNFFIEAKAPRGSMDIATRQAVYDGAFGARAMHFTRNTGNFDGNFDDFDSKSYTFSATYASGVLKLYAHFLTQSDGPTTKICYCMSPLGAWGLEHTVELFRAGVTAFRNLRDVSHQMRTELADVATHNLRELALAGQLPATPSLDPDPTSERDESTSSDMLPSVMDKGSQELGPSNAKRRRKPQRRDPEPAKLSKARPKAKAKAKSRTSRKCTRGRNSI